MGWNNDAEKPVDTYRVGDSAGRLLSDWMRGMTVQTLVSRFEGLLTENILNDSNDHKRSIPGMLSCPECGAPMYAKKYIGKDQKTGAPYSMYWPQCTLSEDPNHGMSKASKHGNKAPFGRKKGSKAPKVNTSVQQPTPPRPVIQKPIEVKAPQGKIFHERFADVLRLYQAGERAFMLKGPAGSGKTTIAQDLAEALDRKFFAVQGSQNTEEANLTSHRNPITGEVKISPAMAAALKEPVVFLIDEGDSIPPGVLLAMNMPLANRQIEVDGTVHKIHPDAVFILAGNAVNGGSRQYTGRFPIDAATRDRFFEVFCDYSPAIDQAICPNDEIRRHVNVIRVRVNNDPQLAKVFIPGGRFLKRCVVAASAYGLGAEKAIRKVLDLSLDPDTASAIMG